MCTSASLTMRADHAVSQRLQQAAAQLQDAIRSTRRRRQTKGDAAESPVGKAWELEPTVLLTSDRGDALSDDTSELQQNDEIDSIDTSIESESVAQTPTKNEQVRAVEAVYDNQQIMHAVEKDMRKALGWMQQDVERQARENRTVRETLTQAIHDITDVIADFVSSEAAGKMLRTAAAATGISPDRDSNAAMSQLAPDKVDELIDLWDDALVSWRERNLVEKQKLMESFTHFEEECLARMKAGEASHRLEQERLALEANQQQMIDEDYSSRLAQKLENANSIIESLRAERKHLSAIATAQTIETDEKNDKESELTIRVKSSEINDLRSEAALAEQTQRANELEARLQMLLEECKAPQHRRDPPRTTEVVQLHRQKLELLEGRMQDVLQQVACDHEQFEYEQAKWALEKRHHREKYDEVLDASVKVLKVLIIREKLMKKNERAHKRSSQENQEKQLELACQATTLQGIATELMQQSAMVLLVLQQLSVLKANVSQHQDTPNNWTLPAKPIQMKNMIKRLKKVEIALGRHDWASLTPTAVPTTKVCPYPALLFNLFLVAIIPATTNAEACNTKACTLDCQPGQKFVLQTGTCIRALCPPIQVCVAESSTSCIKDCAGFQECRVYEPDGSEYCADVCAEGRCPADSACELQEVQCIRTPCPPMATSKMRGFLLLLLALAVTLANATYTKETTACNLACERGKTCKLQEVVCVRAPCNPVPTCVPVESEPACTKTCPKNQVCQIDSEDYSQFCYNPCAATLCLEGTTCQVEQVQCIQAPCQPVVVCKPITTPCTAKRVLRATDNV
ncbi:hypothetical protein P3T76_010075 [Phytophthora citrophthora]|uniref:Uncharacterized protein n=1 Tax=Phytophthora citrophthora TaxID=4793 RepID=A0AAD9GDV6_9STRA|nr:hypothetical protein P3T76_010075 [Phytophthora citrophthora]